VATAAIVLRRVTRPADHQAVPKVSVPIAKTTNHPRLLMGFSRRLEADSSLDTERSGPDRLSGVW
jgi:hypothetical protein